jgi:hypothetical protein
MRHTSAIVVLIILLLSCRKEVPVLPTKSLLIGNWKTIQNGQPNLRWTFDEKTAYQTFQFTGVDSCMVVTPSKSVRIDPYIVRNDTLILEWQDQFFFTRYIYYPIKTLTQDRLVISRYMANEQDSIFERCP